MNYQKYIKYKNKYLQLKEKYLQVGGGKVWVDTVTRVKDPKSDEINSMLIIENFFKIDGYTYKIINRSYANKISDTGINSILILVDESEARQPTGAVAQSHSQKKKMRHARPYSDESQNTQLRSESTELPKFVPDATLDKNEVVEFLSTGSNGFSKVRKSNGSEGYVRTNYLHDIERAVAAQAHSQSFYLPSFAEAQNKRMKHAREDRDVSQDTQLRTSESTELPNFVLGATLHKNEVVEFLSTGSNGFSKVRKSNGSEGYVRTRYLHNIERAVAAQAHLQPHYQSDSQPHLQPHSLPRKAKINSHIYGMKDDQYWGQISKKHTDTEKWEYIEYSTNRKRSLVKDNEGINWRVGPSPESLCIGYGAHIYEMSDMSVMSVMSDKYLGQVRETSGGREDFHVSPASTAWEAPGHNILSIKDLNRTWRIGRQPHGFVNTVKIEVGSHIYDTCDHYLGQVTYIRNNGKLFILSKDTDWNIEIKDLFMWWRTGDPPRVTRERDERVNPIWSAAQEVRPFGREAQLFAAGIGAHIYGKDGKYWGQISGEDTNKWTYTEKSTGRTRNLYKREEGYNWYAGPEPSTSHSSDLFSLHASSLATRLHGDAALPSTHSRGVAASIAPRPFDPPPFVNTVGEDVMSVVAILIRDGQILVATETNPNLNGTYHLIAGKLEDKPVVNTLYEEVAEESRFLPVEKDETKFNKMFKNPDGTWFKTWYNKNGKAQVFVGRLDSTFFDASSPPNGKATSFFSPSQLTATFVELNRHYDTLVDKQERTKFHSYVEKIKFKFVDPPNRGEDIDAWAVRHKIYKWAGSIIGKYVNM